MPVVRVRGSAVGGSKKVTVSSRTIPLGLILLAMLGASGEALAIKKAPGEPCPTGTIDDKNHPGECILEEVTNEPPVTVIGWNVPPVYVPTPTWPVPIGNETVVESGDPNKGGLAISESALKGVRGGLAGWAASWVAEQGVDLVNNVLGDCSCGK